MVDGEGDWEAVAAGQLSIQATGQKRGSVDWIRRWPGGLEASCLTGGLTASLLRWNTADACKQGPSPQPRRGAQHPLDDPPLRSHACVF